ncbi:ABC transporter permease subunit [Achromobacter xylosoxidans]
MDWLIDYYNWRIVSQYAGQFAAGLANTLIALAPAWRCPCLPASRWRWRACRRARPAGPVAGYVQFVRATPLLVQIYLVYYAVPMLIPGAKGWSEMALGIMAMTLHHAAYMSEIIRVGIESVPRGQVEGAKACGMNYGQRLRYVCCRRPSPTRCRRCWARRQC